MFKTYDIHTVKTVAFCHNTHWRLTCSFIVCLFCLSLFYFISSPIFIYTVSYESNMKGGSSNLLRHFGRGLSECRWAIYRLM